MKKITLLFIFFFTLANYAQTKGITYQAVLLNPAANQTRGVGQNFPLMDKQICMSFKFIDEFANVEYQETIQTNTDSYGMVNLIIGTGQQTGGYASSFNDISWSALNKKLVVGVNTNGSCSSFIEISNQDFSYVPFAHVASNAENVTGVVAIENGGTNATTVIQAKTNLQLQNVNNTADLDKPVSAATQALLDIKVDKVTGKGLSTEDYTSSEKTKLAAIIGTNTGDQDLSGYASNVNLDLKANIESPTFTGSPTAPTAEAGTYSTQIATTEYVTDAISTSENKSLPLTGGTLSGEIKGTTAAFTSNVKVSSLTLAGTSIWEFGTNGSGFSLQQGGCCNRLTIDGEGRFGIGANYDPSYQLDVQGDGRFTSDVTATAFKILNGTASQFLKADGSIDTNTYLSVTAASNFVDLSGDQSINGDKRFSNNILVRGTTIGSFGASDTGNIGFGIANYVYGDTSTMYNNTAIGNFAFTSSSGSNNTAIGTNAIRQGDGGSGDENTAVGTAALTNAQAGNRNTAVGAFTMTQAVGSENTAIGNLAGMNISTGSYNTFLGSATGIDSVVNGSINNATAIGSGAKVDTSNTIVLGNSAITDVITNGKITTGAITIPNTDGDAGQVLSTNGSGVVSWTTPSTASSSTFVDLTSNQNISGNKVFEKDAVINGVTVGRGKFNENSNTAVGLGALENNEGYANTAIGRGALASNVSNGGNTALGYIALVSNTSGSDNVAVGSQALETNISGSFNTAIGKRADVSSDGISNSVAIGANAFVTSSNTIQLGSDGTGSFPAITNVKTSGVITSAGYKTTAGTSSQYLMADGSVKNIGTGRQVLSTVVIDYSELNNYDVSNVSILFVRPDSNWTNIYGLQGGVLGQIIHVYSVNNQTSNCCTGFSLWNYDSADNTGIQKFVAPGNYNIDSNQNTTLVFDGTTWRVSSSSRI